MSKFEKSEELKGTLTNEENYEEEEVVDEETTRKLRNLTVDDGIFASNQNSRDQNKNQNKKGDKKKNKRGEDFMDYAKSQGIDVKIQYEDPSQEQRNFNNNYNKDNFNKDNYKNNYNDRNKEGNNQAQGNFYKKGGDRNFKSGARNYNNNEENVEVAQNQAETPIIEAQEATEGYNNNQGTVYQNNYYKNRDRGETNFTNNQESPQNGYQGQNQGYAQGLA